MLCAGLWWAINWFAGEVALAQAEEKRTREEEGGKEGRKERGKSPGEGSDTETETEKEMEGKAQGSGVNVVEGKVGRRKAVPKPAAPITADEPPNEQSQDDGVGGSTELLQPGSASKMSDSGMLSRRRSLGDSTSGTDSEWEKVSDQEGN